MPSLIMMRLCGSEGPPLSLSVLFDTPRCLLLLTLLTEFCGPTQGRLTLVLVQTFQKISTPIIVGRRSFAANCRSGRCPASEYLQHVRSLSVHVHRLSAWLCDITTERLGQ